MSLAIKVDQLTKRYDDQLAIDGITFSVSRNSITGFLGPNGAGKSTTMKILTGFIPASSGYAEVAGIDVSQHPIELKKKIGYLPENNPLYLDMYVHEFLRFAGSIYKMGNQRLKDQIQLVIDQCGLSIEQNKKIGALSKGYRQRVGLAQALIHDPEILILDEPTTGLDPNQIDEVRNLIQEISKSKTVVLSTHIMQEVQAICNQVVLIDRGAIVADDTLESMLKSKSEQNVILLKTRDKIVLEELKKMEGVLSVEMLEECFYKITKDGNKDIRSQLSDWVSSNGYGLIEMSESKASMEEVFKSLTRKNA